MGKHEHTSGNPGSQLVKTGSQSVGRILEVYNLLPMRSSVIQVLSVGTLDSSCFLRRCRGQLPRGSSQSRRSCSGTPRSSLIP
ncbi:hypothetical protein L195_g062831, partial [Trifolium pratense]